LITDCHVEKGNPSPCRVTGCTRTAVRQHHVAAARDEGPGGLGDLGGKVLVLYNVDETPPRRSDSGYRDASDIRAKYFDNEGHVIDYAIMSSTTPATRRHRPSRAGDANRRHRGAHAEDGPA
jgi:hypothetical protein